MRMDIIKLLVARDVGDSSFVYKVDYSRFTLELDIASNVNPFLFHLLQGIEEFEGIEKLDGFFLTRSFVCWCILKKPLIFFS